MLLYHNFKLSPWPCCEKQDAPVGPNRPPATQKIPSIYWNQKVHHRIHKNRHVSPSWAIQAQSIPRYPTSWTSS